jgi:hypothetical protein
MGPENSLGVAKDRQLYPVLPQFNPVHNFTTIPLRYISIISYPLYLFLPSELLLSGLQIQFCVHISSHEEEGVSSYWMTLRKIEGIGN